MQYQNLVDITPHDTNVLDERIQAVLVTVTGNAAVVAYNGAATTLLAIPAYDLLPILPRVIKATATTAVMKGLY